VFYFQIKLADLNIPFNKSISRNATLLWNVSASGCGTTPLQDDATEAGRHFLTTSELIFFYVTPVILVAGLVGNGLSLAVFLQRPLNRMSASTYLATLSMADTFTLIFYVLLEWLKHGLAKQYLHTEIGILNVLNKDGVCQILLYFNYISRIMSSWTIVVFTVERFIAVCYPLKRFENHAKRNVAVMLILAALLVLYKPVLTRENVYHDNYTMCTSMPAYEKISYVLDISYSICITLIPFTIITTLNILLVRKLILRNKMHRTMFADDSSTKIKLEFTVILVAISFCFVLFNVPYTAAWIQWAFSDKENGGCLTKGVHVDVQKAWLTLARTFFYMNYCVNFVLYSVTGKCFRTTLVALLTCKSPSQDNRAASYVQCRRLDSQTTKIGEELGPGCVRSTKK